MAKRRTNEPDSVVDRNDGRAGTGKPASSDADRRSARVYDRPARGKGPNWAIILIVVAILALLLIWIF